MSIDNLLEPTERGHRRHGGGFDPFMPQPETRRASTAVAGKLYPWWGAGGGAPTEGAPIGFTNRDGRYSALHGDPYSWFHLAKYIRSPGLMVIGLNGMGKSTFIKRVLTYYDAIGITCWVLADVKGEYAPLIADMDGQVIIIGRGQGGINPLDMGDAPEAAARIRAKAAETSDPVLDAAGQQMLLDAKLRRRLFIEALFTAQDGTEPSGYEVTLLGTALAELDRTWPEYLEASGEEEHYPILADLLAIFEKPTTELLRAAQWRGDMDRYWVEVDHIVKTLGALTGSEESLGLGGVFNRQSSVAWERNRHVVVDISRVHRDDRALRGALQVGTWILGFGQIAVTQALSDAKLEPERRYCTVQDEMWDAFGTGHGMVKRHNTLTRLDRNEGVVTIKCTHSLGDNRMLSEEDQAQALGMVQRTPMLVCFALDPAEREYLEDINAFTNPEFDYLTSLATPEGWTAPPGTRPPGNGQYGIKLTGRPMLTGELHMSPTEAETMNTNRRWKK